MYLGTFSRLVRSLATIYIFARVRIIGTLVPGRIHPSRNLNFSQSLNISFTSLQQPFLIILPDHHRARLRTFSGAFPIAAPNPAACIMERSLSPSPRPLPLPGKFRVFHRASSNLPTFSTPAAVISRYSGLMPQTGVRRNLLPEPPPALSSRPDLP